MPISFAVFSVTSDRPILSAVVVAGASEPLRYLMRVVAIGSVYGSVGIGISWEISAAANWDSRYSL